MTSVGSRAPNYESCLLQPVSHLIDFPLVVANSIPEVSAFCVWREQLQADGVIVAFSLQQLLLALLHLSVSHSEMLQ